MQGSAPSPHPARVENKLEAEEKCTRAGLAPSSLLGRTGRRRRRTGRSRRRTRRRAVSAAGCLRLAPRAAALRLRAGCRLGRFALARVIVHVPPRAFKAQSRR